MITRKWYTTHYIKKFDSQLPIKQIYVWLITSDKNIVIVSKTGDKWQLPGGKPKEGESLTESAVREVKEETGINIIPNISELEVFGYYIVKEDTANYIQVRAYLKLPWKSSQLKLKPDEAEGEPDQIQFAKFVSKGELLESIEWMSTSAEFKVVIEAKLL